ncbi:MAG: hypothetical protein KBS86_00820 [Proteobacteria bacterium]|nr:hypothetical protein [Candidatus Enterousia scatequi]
MKYIIFIAGVFLLTSPAMADLASKTYVSTVENNLNDNISGKLDNKFENGTNKALVTTGTNGAVQTGQIASGMIANDAVNSAKIKDGDVTNAKIASGIGINKLNLPTKCTSGSCMLIYNADSGNFVWENIGRNGGSAPTGGVSGN